MQRNKQPVSYLVNTKKSLSLNCTYSPKRSGHLNNLVRNLQSRPETMCRLQHYCLYRTLSMSLKTAISPREGCSVVRKGRGQTAYIEFNFGYSQWALWQLGYLKYDLWSFCLWTVSQFQLLWLLFVQVSKKQWYRGTAPRMLIILSYIQIIAVTALEQI
jgi:hypothetical protein